MTENKQSPQVNLNLEIDPEQKVTPINTESYSQHHMMQASFQAIKTPYLPPEFLESYEKFYQVLLGKYLI